MPRIRTIKPEFPQSETIGRLSRDARLLFIMLWTFVDDSGRARASSRLLASALYPYDEDAGGLIERWLVELDREGCIRRYIIDGKSYLDIPNWLKHQKIDRPSPSRIPEFDEASRALDEPSSTDLGPRIKDLGSRTKDLGPANEVAADAAREDVFEDRFWKPYPRKIGKDAARKAWKAALKRAPPETILAGLAAYRWPEDPQFIPHPSTWLNGGRWADEQPANGEQNGFGHIVSGGRRAAKPSFEDQCRADRAAILEGLGLDVAGTGGTDPAGGSGGDPQDPAELARVVGSGRA
jgi:hypothetical protein